MFAPISQQRLFLLIFVVISLAGAPAAAAPFDRAWLQPYFASGDAARARRLLLARQPDKAAPLLHRHLARKDTPHHPQARFLLAHALLRSGKVKEAWSQFRRLGKEYPLLDRYLRINMAEAKFRLGKYRQAAAQARALEKDAVLGLRAAWLRARALCANSGQRKQCMERLRAFLERSGLSHGRRLEARRLLARTLLRSVGRGKGRVKGTKAKHLKQALVQLKRVVIEGPLSPNAEAAAKQLARVARRLRGGKAMARLTPAERYEQAMVLDRAMRNARTEKALTRLLKLKGLGKALRCKARYHQARAVFKQRDRARAEPLYVKAIKACRRAGDDDLVVKSLYNGARGLVRKGKQKAALARYAELEKRHRRHSYADDARLRAAEVKADMGDDAGAAKLLASIPTRYPGGDMKREALWRLSRQAYFAGQLDAALEHLDRIINTLGRAGIYYAHGRALYWKARILVRQKKVAAAHKIYARCAREYPLSYYALLSFNRLREADRPAYEALVKELLPPPGEAPGRWTFRPRALFGKAGFLRGVELARLGFGKAAARELAAVGVEVERGRAPADLWLAAVLYDRAGLWHLSHRVPRTLDKRYRWTYPLAENRRRWAISYPGAFLPEVRANARRAGIPPWLALAVMREESGFSPTIESWANAVGLMQLILPTARTMAKMHGLAVDRQALHDPAVNIKLGATYLGYLLEAFGRAFPLAISGYNAGGGATFRWLKRFKTLNLDELVELIPYDQTRRYTKRVLSSLFTYSVLYGDDDVRVPVIPAALPVVVRSSFAEAKKKIKKGKM